jgi:hypothetical protein
MVYLAHLPRQGIWHDRLLEAVDDLVCVLDRGSGGGAPRFESHDLRTIGYSPTSATVGSHARILLMQVDILALRCGNLEYGIAPKRLTVAQAPRHYPISDSGGAAS